MCIGIFVWVCVWFMSSFSLLFNIYLLIVFCGVAVDTEIITIIVIVTIYRVLIAGQYFVKHFIYTYFNSLNSFKKLWNSLILHATELALIPADPTSNVHNVLSSKTMLSFCRFRPMAFLMTSIHLIFGLSLFFWCFLFFPSIVVLSKETYLSILSVCFQWCFRLNLF